MPLVPEKPRPPCKKAPKPEKDETWREFDSLLQEKGPETLEGEKYHSLFVGGAHRLFPSEKTTILGRYIASESYKEICDFGDVGLIEPKPVERGPESAQSDWFLTSGRPCEQTLSCQKCWKCWILISAIDCLLWSERRLRNRLRQYRGRDALSKKW